MSHPSSSSLPLPADFSPTSQTGDQELQSLKRRICALEVENAHMLSKISKQPTRSLRREGQAVRRLVTLVESISDITAEHDRRQLRLAEDGATLAMIQSESTPEEERLYNNFKKLIQWCPSVAKLLDAGLLDLFAFRELQAGCDAARGDDASTLKSEVIHWITSNTEHVEPLLSPRDKEGRGLNHLLTGRLLCPVDYDWANHRVRAAIREYHPDFRVTAYSWPLFLYKGYIYNPNEPCQGLFQSDLLVKAFKCIFTSPSSAHRHDELGDNAIRSKGPRARSHVADLLRMRSVQPRAIAYIAAQVRFALSSTTSWTMIDDDFNYETFYYHIVEYFETPSSLDKAAETQSLLLWWNRIVFGRRNVSDYRPLQPEALSVARSRK